MIRYWDGQLLFLQNFFLSCTQFYPFLLHKMRNLKIAIYVVKISRKMKVKIQLNLFNKKVQEKGAGHFWTS